MKRITIIAILIAVVLSASAQGEWKWANYWTGNDDPLNSNNAYNYVVRTAFDDDGNVYVYGCFGGNAKVYDQNTSEWLCDDVAVILANTKGCALMKFDSLGNLLWSRTIKKSKQGDCRPYDMVLHDGQILISGLYDLAYGPNENLWFLDTLITQQTAFNLFLSGEIHPPYSYTDGIYTFFSVLDLNGNVLENHFVKVLSRAEENRVAEPIGYGVCPMCVDSYGNFYVATAIAYGGPDTLPWTVVIDEDTAKTYDLYLPGCSDMPGITNMMLFKFSPNFELISSKLVVDHTVGVSPYIPFDTVNPAYTPYVLGLSIDDEDNLYLSGYLRDMYLMNEYNEYPMRFYWDSTHYATADDPSTGKFLPYIVKYDSDGNVRWSNQVSVSNDPSTDFYHFAVWGDNCVAGDGVYLMGHAEASPGHNPLFYFDDPSNCLSIIPNTYQHTSFFVKFDKETGVFKSLGQTPGLHTFILDGSRPAVINNHLLGLFRYDFATGGTLFNAFNIGGSFVGADTISYSHDPIQTTYRTILNDEGKILCDMTCSQDLTFGHDFTLSFDDHTRSHAVVAYRYDPSILVPYSEDSVGISQFNDVNAALRLYPNPANNILYLENEEFPIELVVIYDITGKELIREETFDNRCAINISALPNGIYTVKTVCGEQRYSNKFIKTSF